MYEVEEAGVERSCDRRPHSCPLRYETASTIELSRADAIATPTEKNTVYQMCRQSNIDQTICFYCHMVKAKQNISSPNKQSNNYHLKTKVKYSLTCTSKELK